MAKGFMVFVEGGKLPKVLHKEYASAYTESLRLSTLNPDKDVLLLEFHYRMRNGRKHETTVSVVTLPLKLKRMKTKQQGKGN